MMKLGIKNYLNSCATDQMMAFQEFVYTNGSESSIDDIAASLLKFILQFLQLKVDYLYCFKFIDNKDL